MSTATINGHERLIEDLLAFYRRELVESTDGRDALSKIGITEPGIVERCALGWASGRAMGTLSESQHAHLCTIGLATQRTEKLSGCIVLPVRDAAGGGGGALLDLHGLRPWQSGLRYVPWHTPSRGLIGADAMTRCGEHDDGELILCDNAFHYLHALQHGYANAAAIRTLDELAGHLPAFEAGGVERVYVVSRNQREARADVLRKAGIEAVGVTVPAKGMVVPGESYREAMAKRSRAVRPEPSAPGAPASRRVVKRAEVEVASNGDSSGGVVLVERTDHRLMFAINGVRYAIESAAATGLSMRGQIRAERDGVTFIDRLDLASASSRRKVARHAAARLALASGDVEDHLTAIAERVDRLIIEASASTAGGGGRQPEPMSEAERERAMAVLAGGDVLAYLAESVEAGSGGGGFVGEEANKRLAILIAASRLLPKPLGALIRGPAGCGKSSLMAAIRATLPADQVLYFSRLTPQALYFLPADELRHKLLVCDEYAGMADSEYAVRSMMSSQTLSLAITVRDSGNGGAPLTRSIEVPATVAVMVSTTAGVNVENLSRFIEIGLSDSTEQTRRVMSALAHRGTSQDDGTDNGPRRVNALLRPCSVVIHYADQLTYAGHGVLARRRFAQIVGLIAAHAALHQHQRPRREDAGRLIIEASKADYAAVYPLLASVVDHFEESVSPAAMRLLVELQASKSQRVTVGQVMERMGWSYSTARRVLVDLAALDLMTPDTMTNGVLRTFEVAPYYLPSDRDRGITTITPPDAIT